MSFKRIYLFRVLSGNASMIVFHPLSWCCAYVFVQIFMYIKPTHTNVMFLLSIVFVISITKLFRFEHFWAAVSKRQQQQQKHQNDWALWFLVRAEFSFICTQFCARFPTYRDWHRMHVQPYLHPHTHRNNTTCWATAGGQHRTVVNACAHG